MEHVHGIPALVFLVLLHSAMCQSDQCSPVISPVIPVTVPAPGMIMEGGKRDAKIVIEAFLDFMCWGSAKAWKTLNKVKKNYNPSEVSVIIHMMSLPYHRNSHIALQGFLWLKDNKPGIMDMYIDTLYEKKTFKKLSNEATREMNYFWVRSELTDIATSTMEIPRDNFQFNLNKYDQAARDKWKYAVSRGVAGAPWYFVNGIDLGVDPKTDLSYEEWINYIDGLLNKNKHFY